MLSLDITHLAAAAPEHEMQQHQQHAGWAQLGAYSVAQASGRAAHAVANVASANATVSPSKNPCKVRVRPGNYRNDPYRAVVVVITALPPIEAQRPQGAGVAADAAGDQQCFQAATVTAAAGAAAAAAPDAGRGVLPRLLGAGTEVKDRAEPVVAEPDMGVAPSAYVHVQFKYDGGIFRGSPALRPGDTVLVDGDRGIHIGRVQRVFKKKPPHPVLAQVHRLATSAEVARIAELRSREAAAKTFAAALASKLLLPLTIVATEMQFDEQKLTIFFESSVFIDFRRLQRALFREFNCRIWLVNWRGDKPPDGER